MVRALLAVLAVGGLFLAPAAEGRIKDGWAAAQAHPAQAQVYVGTGTGVTMCGGTLVAPRWVLTAAHCVSDPATDAAVAPAAVAVRLGSSWLFEGTPHAVDAVERPAGWDAGRMTGDAALLHLTAPAAEAPLAPASAEEVEAFGQAGRTARVLGWGRTSADGPASMALMEADVPLVADAACADGAMYGGGFDAATMLCAGGLGADACEGDSGGPLMIDVDAAPDAGWRQVGIASWGSGCGGGDRPSVYTRLSAGLRGWIAETTSRPEDPEVPAGGVDPASSAPAVPLASFAAPAAEGVLPATIGLPSSCAAGACRVWVSFHTRGNAAARLWLSRRAARRLGLRSRLAARATVVAAGPGVRVLRLRLSGPLRARMRARGLRGVRARLRVTTATVGARPTAAAATVRVRR